MLNQKRITLILRVNLALAFAEGLLVLWSFLEEPSESTSAVFFGFSYLRLVLILVVLSLLLTILVLLFGSFRNSWQAEAGEKFLVRLANQRWIFWIFTLWLAISYVLLFSSEQQLGSLSSYRERLLPLLLWLVALSVQFGFVLLYLRGIKLTALQDHRDVLIPALVILTLFGLLLLVITLTRIGLTPDNVYWQGPGTPILLHQVFLAGIASALFYWFIARTNLGRSTKLDVVVFLALWGFACLIWLSQPAKLTYFSLEPKEPNFQIYPFSDALIYDSTAHEFLIGKPIPGDFWVKPLYSLFLALLHLFSGNNYALLVSLQVAILAIIPSFVYMLTTHLDQRLAGLVAALLIIIRERNAMALSNVIQVSHSKLLLSDVFAMGEMIILVWLVVWWLQHPVERRAAPFAVGGMLGLLILTRGHPVLMIPFIFLVGFIVLKPNLRLWYESSLRIILGLSLVLIPWFWHTYQFTGKIAFQDPSSPYARNDTLVKLYTQSSNSAVDPVSPNSSSYEEFQSQAFKSMLEHPVDVTYFTSTHYFHNMIFSYLYLPESFQIEDLNAYVKRLPFWNRWDGFIPAETRVLLLLNFAVLSLGISVAWKRVNRLMFAPLVLGAAYNLSIAVARRSGWRFILPADWITLIFYAIGLIQFIVIIQSFVNQRVEQPDGSVISLPPSSESIFHQQSPVMFGLPFFLIAMGLVLGHHLFPLHYPVKNTQELLQDYDSTARVASNPEFASLKTLVQRGDATIFYGRALYPIYLGANEGMVNFNWASFAPKPYKRLAFYLVGPQSTSVNLPMESPPFSFPDGVSVIVVGCKAETGDINALAVLIQGASPIHYIRESFPTPACPLPEPN